MHAVFRLLLAFSMILNGLSPVWASGAMAHGQHLMPVRSTADAEPAGQVHPAQHDHASMQVSALPAELPSTPAGSIAAHADPDQENGCCGDPTACQCGCVLPPAMLLSLRLQALDFVAVAPAPRQVGGLALAAIGPPFRPPSA